MKRLVPLLLLVLVACGDAEPPVPAPGPTAIPAPEPEPEIGAFTLETHCGIPDRSPPVLVRGDANGVKIAVHRLDEPSLPLGWDQLGKVVFEGAAKSDEWYFLPPMSAGIYRVTATRGEERQQRWLVVSDLAVIAQQAAEFGERMDEVALSLSDQIEIVGDSITMEVDNSDVSLDMEIEREMARYRDKPVKKSEPDTKE